MLRWHASTLALPIWIPLAHVTHLITPKRQRLFMSRDLTRYPDGENGDVLWSMQQGGQQVSSP
jgi:hypothetical protein